MLQRKLWQMRLRRDGPHDKNRLIEYAILESDLWPLADHEARGYFQLHAETGIPLAVKPGSVACDTARCSEHKFFYENSVPERCVVCMPTREDSCYHCPSSSAA